MLRNLVVSASVALLATAACAQTIVYDPTNFAETSLSATKAAEATVQRGNAYVKQLEQYRLQVQQVAKLNPQAVQGLLDKNAADMASAVQFITAAQHVYGSVSQVRSNFQTRLDEARTLGMAWDTYVGWEQNRINRNVQAAVDRAQMEQRVAEQAKRDLEWAQQAEKNIDDPTDQTGVHAQMQNVNLQLNKLVTQQAQFTQLMSGSASAAGLAYEEASQQNEADARALARRQYLEDVSKATRASEERARARLNNLK